MRTRVFGDSDFRITSLDQLRFRAIGFTFSFHSFNSWNFGSFSPLPGGVVVPRVICNMDAKRSQLLYIVGAGVDLDLVPSFQLRRPHPILSPFLGSQVNTCNSHVERTLDYWFWKFFSLWWIFIENLQSRAQSIYHWKGIGGGWRHIFKTCHQDEGSGWYKSISRTTGYIRSRKWARNSELRGRPCSVCVCVCGPTKQGVRSSGQVAVGASLGRGLAGYLRKTYMYRQRWVHVLWRLKLIQFREISW